MNKQNVVYLYNGRMRQKKEWGTNIRYNLDELLKHYPKWNKPVTKDYISCNSIHMKCPEYVNLQTGSRLVTTYGWG